MFSCWSSANTVKWSHSWDTSSEKPKNTTLTCISSWNASRILRSLSCCRSMPRSRSSWPRVSKGLSSLSLESTSLLKSRRIKNTAPLWVADPWATMVQMEHSWQRQAFFRWEPSLRGSTSCPCSIRYQSCPSLSKTQIRLSCWQIAATSPSARASVYWTSIGPEAS